MKYIEYSLVYHLVHSRGLNMNYTPKGLCIEGLNPKLWCYSGSVMLLE